MRHGWRLPLTCLFTALLAVPSLLAKDPAGNETDAPPARRVWTLDAALAQLRLYPRDSYLQYVALQLARREGKLDEVAEKLEELQDRPSRREGVDLFTVFTGALAVQESLQLDRMRGTSQVIPKKEPRVGPPPEPAKEESPNAPEVIGPPKEDKPDASEEPSTAPSPRRGTVIEQAPAPRPADVRPAPKPAEPSAPAEPKEDQRIPFGYVPNDPSESGTCLALAEPETIAEPHAAVENDDLLVPCYETHWKDVHCTVCKPEYETTFDEQNRPITKCRMVKEDVVKKVPYTVRVMKRASEARQEKEPPESEETSETATPESIPAPHVANETDDPLVPCYETHWKEAHYTVTKPVCETSIDKEGHPITVTHMVKEDCVKKVPYTVCVMKHASEARQSKKPSGSEDSTEPAAPEAEEKSEPALPEDTSEDIKKELSGVEIVPLDALTGPEIKSHPWDEMLEKKLHAKHLPTNIPYLRRLFKNAEAARRLDVDPLAGCVPEDFYFVEFRSLRKLLEAGDLGDLWGTRLLTQTTGEAWTQPAVERLQHQLAVETHPLLRPLYDLAIEEVAVTGSDLFVREGSDVTLLFRLKRPDLFHTTMDGFLDSAEKSHPDAKRTTGEYLGIQYVSLTTPDHTVYVFAADPKPDLHVRSNSEAAFRRVLEAIQGKTHRLGESSEYAYIRTLMPRGASTEDGFVYLSDPFIRHMVGPKLKLTERRRMLCYNHLRMLGHASLMFRSENGRPPVSFEELVRTGCAPGVFNCDELQCPDGGCYVLGADGTATCTCHGHAHDLTPCCEIPLDEVTGAEAADYEEFRKGYNEYWKTYFDPIALRLQLTPQQYRVETLVLPLIDNTIYSSLARYLGGGAEALDALPVPGRNIFSLAVRLNKEAILKDVGLTDREAEDDGRDDAVLGLKGVTYSDLKGFVCQGIGNQVGVHVYDFDPTFYFSLPGLFSGAGQGSNPLAMLDSGGLGLAGLALGGLNSPYYFSFAVQDEQIVDRFLATLDKALAPLGRQRSELAFDYYKLRQKGRNVRCFAAGFGPVKFRFYAERIGKGLYLTNKPFVLDDIHAATMQESVYAGTEEGILKDNGPEAHAMFRVRAEHWDKVLSDYRLAWAENHRAACLENLGPLASVQRARPEGAEAQGWDTRVEAERLYGVRFTCPEGGRYVYSKDGTRCRCTIHGSADHPRQALAPDANGLPELLRQFRGMTATLTFLEDGLRAVVTVERKP